jgi:hypothetical protein
VRFYAFGAFVVDSVKRTIHRDGIALPLSSRAFDTLLLLIHHRERVLEKDEILQEVWREVIVEENTLVPVIVPTSGSAPANRKLYVPPQSKPTTAPLPVMPGSLIA